MLTVVNRSAGRVYYSVPEMNISREYQPREKKQVSIEEVRAVCQQSGGRELFYNYLMIEDEDVLHQELNVNEEPEYWLKESQIPAWINTCTNEEFLDALKFAPVGVKDLIKKYSVEVPLNDMNKRRMLMDHLGFDVTKSLEITKPTPEEIAQAEAKKVVRKRASNPNYKQQDNDGVNVTISSTSTK